MSKRAPKSLSLFAREPIAAPESIPLTPESAALTPAPTTVPEPEISPYVRAVIVRRYAQTGEWCLTAQRIFLGGGAKGRIDGKYVLDGTQVAVCGHYPAALIAECNAARALYLSQRSAA